MSRRKGERPIVRTLCAYDDTHPVARAIATGSQWFGAWLAQETTPYHRLSKMTGIAVDRIWEIDRGARITGGELEQLAAAWFVPPADLLLSMPAHVQP